MQGLVQSADGLDQSLQDVVPLASLGQIELGSTDHHVVTVFDEYLQLFLQREHARLVVHQGQVDYAEGDLHLGVLEQLVEDDLFHDVLAQVDDYAHAVAVRLVAQVGYALDLLVLDQLGDALH